MASEARKADDSPPPPYTLTDDGGIGSSSSTARTEGLPSVILVTPPSPDTNAIRPASPFQFNDHNSPPLHAPFGPTPLLQQAQPLLLPYYDPRSPYSLAQADNRARTRFVAAVLWTLVFILISGVVCAVLTQGEVDWDPNPNWPDDSGRHRAHRHANAETWAPW